MTGYITLTLHKYSLRFLPHSYDWVHLTLHKYLGSPILMTGYTYHTRT